MMTCFSVNWDVYLSNEIDKEKNNKFYFSGTNVSYKDGIINHDCVR